MTTAPNQTAHLITAASEAEQAYDRVLPEILALPSADVLVIRTDVGNAVKIALATVDRVEPFRDLLEELPGFDVANLDALRDLALAAYHTQATYVDVEDDGVAELASEALALRSFLVRAARALADVELVSAGRVDQIREGRSYIDLATDLHALRRLFGDAAATIEGKTAVTAAHLERAGALGVELLDALGDRETNDAEGPSPSELRARAFTLLRHAYDQIRRAVHYTRWDDGDAAELVPSFYAKTRRRRRSAEAEAATESQVTAPVAPARPLSVVPATTAVA